MKVPLPERGQPIDVQYLYGLVEAINDIANAVSSATFNYTTIDTGVGRKTTQTSQAMIFGGTIALLSNEYVVKETSKTWHIDLPPGYEYPPNVTCSVINAGTSTTGNDVIATITKVTESRVEGIAKFLSSGSASININVMAIGIPR